MSDRLRIAIFGESYLPYLSGVTVSTEALANGLAGAGHEVLLVVPRPASGGEAGTAPRPGGEVTTAWLPSYQGPRPAPPHYRMPWPIPSRALRQAAAFAPDVVHAQSPFVSGLMARRVARRVGAPLVFTHHTRFADYGHYLGPVARLGSALVERYLAAWWAGCAAVVAPGSELADEIRERLSGRQRPLVRTIPTGIDMAWIGGLVPADPRELADWPADTTVVVSVGRLAPEKSVDILVAAFLEAAATDDRLRLLLVGGGPSDRRLRALASGEAQTGRLHLTGSLPRDAALSLAAGSDLFAFASRTETQGLVLSEALACGLPVVAVAAPGVRDAVRDGLDGRVVAAEPAADLARRLARAISEVAGDAERRRGMAVAAAEGAARFDQAARIDEIVALYREVATDHR